MSTKAPSGRGVNNPSHAPQYQPAPVSAGGEPIQQRRLAHPGLAGDEHQPALAPSRLVSVFGQRAQCLLPLKQSHAHSVGHMAPRRQSRGAARP